MPLFAAADQREQTPRPELTEPTVSLVPMTAGREVVEDYRSKGLTLGTHPVGFLRRELSERGFAACATLRNVPNGQRISVAGLVLVRQMPGSANGVMFITLEDESDVANLIIWPSLFERQRKAILSAGMMGVRGRVQCESGVIHVVAEHVLDLSADLRRVSGLEEPFPLVGARRDDGHPDSRTTDV